ncbi:MAG: hypothetical protein KDC18_05390 [Alphaproteobacteria bacterium]|nr:hypothetical protein [Alphaproteobacteria bacterium]MCB9929157.1 hypothetical protein [Alphaproteobacteria bacterium]
MPTSSRRQVLGAAALAVLAPSVLWRVPAQARTPVRFTAAEDLPVLEMDVATSIAKRHLVTRGQSYRRMPRGAVIMVPAGVDIPAAWWELGLRRNAPTQDGARFIIRGEGPNRRGRLVAPGKQGVISLNNRIDRKVSFEFEDLEIRAGLSGDGVRLVRGDHVRLQRVKVTGGKNGIATTTNPIDVELIDCDLHHSGRGGGKTHAIYVSYIRNMTVRNCRISAPKALGHVFKCYARHLDIRDSHLSHYETAEDLAQGYYGGLPLFDRGAWGSTIAVGNTLVRRGPVRSPVITLRNRAYPPGYAKWVDEGWGTEAVDFHQVDNRNPQNPYLFRHLFYQNRIQNGVLPDGGVDPDVRAKPGVLLRNNGSAPWAVVVRGKSAQQGMPADWQPQNERAVAYLVANRTEGVPFDRMTESTPYKNPEAAPTPIVEADTLPQWAADWIRD